MRWKRKYYGTRKYYPPGYKIKETKNHIFSTKENLAILAHRLSDTELAKKFHRSVLGIQVQRSRLKKKKKGKRQKDSQAGRKKSRT
ncbi:MAG: hypothetical protein WAP55_00495 [Minisyncoccia bacterium]